MAPSHLYLFGLVLACMDPCETTDVSAMECRAGGSECNAIANAACDTTATKCKCALITTMSAGACEFKTCTSAAVECNVDINAECTGSSPSKCACKSTFALTKLDNKHVCLATIDSTVCTATGNQCLTVSNSYCHGTELKCKCPAIFTAGTNNCTAKACVVNATCTSVDANSVCSGTTATERCVCKAGFIMGTDGKCSTGTTIGGTVCTATGNQCSPVSNSYCHATELTCKCPAITTAGTNDCTAIECVTAATCTSVDANSECSGTSATDRCLCKAGFTIGSDGKCSKSGATGLAACLSIILVSILTTIV